MNRIFRLGRYSNSGSGVGAAIKKGAGNELLGRGGNDDEGGKKGSGQCLSPTTLFEWSACVIRRANTTGRQKKNDQTIKRASRKYDNTIR